MSPRLNTAEKFIVNSKRVAIYVRVSTDEQAKEGYSIDAQLEKLRAFCFSQGWSVYKEYIEEGVSAKNLKRPKIKEMLSELRLFDIVLVYKLDRLSRSVGDINDLLQTFEQSEVSFKSATEPYDTTTAQGKLLINIFASLAQFEREQNAERVKFALDNKVESGERAGSPAPFGYDLSDGKLVINKEEAKWVRYIFEEFKTKGKRAVADQLNKAGVRTKRGMYWSDSSISYLISNPVYCGDLRWNYIVMSASNKAKRSNDEMIIADTHEAIISKELFKEVQSIRKSRAKTGFKGTSTYPFTSRLKCARCGRAIIGTVKIRKKSKVRIYQCTGKTKDKICDLPPIHESILDELFFDDVIRFLEVPQTPLSFPESEIDIKSLERELKLVRSRIERIKDMYEDGDITKDEKTKRLKKAKEKETEINDQLGSVGGKVDVEKVRNSLDDLESVWSDLSYEERKKAIHVLVDFIKVDVGKVAKTRFEKSEVKIMECKFK